MRPVTCDLSTTQLYYGPSKRYPIIRTVWMYTGRSGLGSTFWRSQRIWTSSVCERDGTRLPQTSHSS